MRVVKRTRLLITAALLTGVILVTAGLLLAFTSSGFAQGNLPPSNIVLAAQIANSTDECVVCHTDQTPGIVNQYALSDHYTGNVTCSNCHLVDADYPGAVQHPEQDYWVLTNSSSAMCEDCHREQVQQFNLSRHGLPSYVAYAGSAGLTEEQQALYQSIPEGGADPTGRTSARNAIHAMEGDEFTRFSCESCHDVGAPAPDGSVGDCTACHLRHEFSLEQVRRPKPVTTVISVPTIRSGKSMLKARTASPT